MGDPRRDVERAGSWSDHDYELDRIEIGERAALCSEEPDRDHHRVRSR